MNPQCEHRRISVECGECGRNDIAAGQEVRVADEGSRAALVTWFDGVVVSKTAEGRCVVRVDVFGESTWDMLKARYPPQDVAQALTPAAPVAPANPTPAAPLPAASPIPLTHVPSIGQRVVISNDRDELERIFQHKQWTLSEKAAEKSGMQAKVTAVDKKDGTLRLMFDGPIDVSIAKQWWPSDCVKVVTAEGAAQAEKVSRAVLPTPPAGEVRDDRAALRNDLEDALHAAQHAVNLYAPTEPATQAEAASLQKIADTCAHGNLREECGKCPRPDLAAGLRVEATDVTTDTAVWFEGVVEDMHQFGYPKVRVHGMESLTWERVRRCKPKVVARCRHVDARGEALMKHDPSIMCGVCDHPDVSIGEDLFVSLDGAKWSEGTVILRHPATNSLSIALRTQLQAGTLNTLNSVGGKKGFTWKFIKRTVAKLRDEREFQEQYIMRKCEHRRGPDECGECARRDLRKRQAVCVSMDGEARNRAVFEGFVTGFRIPDGAPLVTVESFGEMVWDRVWAPDAPPPASAVNEAFLRHQAEARLPPTGSLLPRAEQVSEEAQRRQAIDRHNFLQNLEENRRELKSKLQAAAADAEAVALEKAATAPHTQEAVPQAPAAPEGDAGRTEEASPATVEPQARTPAAVPSQRSSGSNPEEGYIKPAKVLRQHTPFFNPSMMSEMQTRLTEKNKQRETPRGADPPAAEMPSRQQQEGQEEKAGDAVPPAASAAVEEEVVGVSTPASQPAVEAVEAPRDGVLQGDDASQQEPSLEAEGGALPQGDTPQGEAEGQAAVVEEVAAAAAAEATEVVEEGEAAPVVAEAEAVQAVGGAEGGGPEGGQEEEGIVQPMKRKPRKGGRRLPTKVDF